MHHFLYKEGELYCEDVPLREIADAVGTPTYVYSAATFRRHFRVFDGAFSGHPHLVCYSVKACSNLGVLKLLAAEGSGFDVVSGGELVRCLTAGIPASRIIFGGVGKTAGEMKAALDADILLFNVESEAELDLLDSLARSMGKRAPVALRINPDVDPRTHPYIATGLRSSKFGIPLSEGIRLYQRAASLPGLEVVGIDCHIGSQLTDLDPVIEALRHLLDLVSELERRGHHLRFIDLGGGLGIPYSDETPPEPARYGAAIVAELAGRSETLLLEPGRVIAGNAGVLLTRTLYRKSNVDKSFVIVDAAMNDAMRPALYGAHHALWPVRETTEPEFVVDVVGPVCETGDFLAKGRALPLLASGELLALMSAGAYGFSMSSNYNSRPRAAEVLVDGAIWRQVRRRETIEDLLGPELETS